MTKEELAKQIMRECAEDGEPIEMADALEMAEMELKAKDIKNYTQSTTEKVKKAKERKVDIDKLVILNALAEQLREIGFEPKIEKEVAIHFGEYSLKLTRHRPPKK